MQELQTSMLSDAVAARSAGAQGAERLDAPLRVRSAVSGLTVHLETFGCQMNELDSELVRGSLGALGYRFVDAPGDADVVLYNTCSVREQAENKVWSRVGLMGKRKREGASLVLGVIGCMAEREGTAMMRRFPQIDLMCGPGELDKLPMLIDNALKTGAAEASDRAQVVALQGNTHRRSSTLAAAEDNLEMLDLSRAFDPDRSTAGGGGRSAYVRITRGCNKFCTYCVVPYTRGAEVHRAPDAIVDECKRLADAGVIEVTLLGQTVNHYSYVHGAAVSPRGVELPQIGGKSASLFQGEREMRTTSFADLLRRIHDEAPAIQRLRFVTSYPRDFDDETLQVMRDCPRICRYLHVPAQSGSNRILKLMNRGYTVEQYFEFIDRALTIVPEVCIAGDIIVGFPTETDEDFEQTKDLLRRVPFKNNFIFKYSPRPGTVAIDRFADDVPEDVKRRRNNELLALQNAVSARVHATWVGKTVNVLVDRISREAGAAPAAVHHAGSVNAFGVEERWNRDALPPRGDRNGATSSVGVSKRPSKHGVGGAAQLSGRTPGDLIVAFDAPAGAEPHDLLGRIVPVRIDGCSALFLQGQAK